MNSKPYSLNVKDIGKGLLMAVGTPILLKLAEAMNVPGFDFVGYNWHSLIAAGVSAGIVYLIKNFVSDAQGTPFGRAQN